MQKEKKKKLLKQASKTNAAFGTQEIENNSTKNSEDVKTFLNGFGSIRKVQLEETMPSYATYKICMYYWET